MIVLADNDILLKLAACDLFAEFLSAFAVTPADIQILKLARFSLNSKKHRKRLGDDSYARLVAFLASIADIPTEPDPMVVAALAEQTDKNIDAGEAALFAICPLIPGSIIVTGDKKSLTGLHDAGMVDATCATLCNAITRRIYCFEQVLVTILDHVGFDVIRDRLIAGRECDKGLRLWIGNDLNATEEVVREGLTSFLNEARQTSGSLLA